MKSGCTKAPCRICPRRRPARDYKTQEAGGRAKEVRRGEQEARNTHSWTFFEEAVDDQDFRLHYLLQHIGAHVIDEMDDLAFIDDLDHRSSDEDLDLLDGLGDNDLLQYHLRSALRFIFEQRFATWSVSRPFVLNQISSADTWSGQV